MHGVERRQDQDIRPDCHALRVCRDVAHDWRDLQHLHRMGQPVVREPEGRETGITRRAHLRDHLRDAFGEIEALRELRVDEQTNLHDPPFFSAFCAQLTLDVRGPNRVGAIKGLAVKRPEVASFVRSARAGLLPKISGETFRVTPSPHSLLRKVGRHSSSLNKTYIGPLSPPRSLARVRRRGTAELFAPYAPLSSSAVRTET